MGHGADGHGCGKYKHGESGHHYSEKDKEQISNGHKVVITQLQSLLDGGSLTEEEAASVKMHMEILQMKSEKRENWKKGKWGKKGCGRDKEKDTTADETSTEYQTLIFGGSLNPF